MEFVDSRPLAPGVGGHPIGVEWFCRDHEEGGRRLNTLRSSEALDLLRRQDGVAPGSYAEPERVGLVLAPGNAGRAKFVLALRKLFALSLPIAKELGTAPVVFSELEFGTDIDAMIEEASAFDIQVKLGKAPAGSVRLPSR